MDNATDTVTMTRSEYDALIEKVDSLSERFDHALTIIGEIAEKVAPVMQSLEKSPIIKMLGGK